MPPPDSLPPLSSARWPLGPHRAGRKRLRLLDGHVLPLGALWLGRVHDPQAHDVVRWLVELRLGLHESAATAPTLDPATGRVREVPVAPRPVLVAPVLVLRPCLHRARDEAALTAAFARWTGTGDTGIGLAQLWALGEEAAAPRWRVPRHDDLGPDLVIESYDAAEAATRRVTDARDDRERARALRQLLSRFPAALLSPAGHLGRALEDLDPEAPATSAAVDGVRTAHGRMQRRGRWSFLGLPDAEVDLYLDFPTELRRQSRGPHRWSRFIAALALGPGRHPDGEVDALAEVLEGPEGEANNWRRWVRAPHWGASKAFWLADLGSRPAWLDRGDPTEAQGLQLLVRWLVTPEVADALSFLRQLERARWEQSPLLQWDGQARSGAVGFEVRRREAPWSVEEWARLRAMGAEPVRDGEWVRWWDVEVVGG